MDDWEAYTGGHFNRISVFQPRLDLNHLAGRCSISSGCLLFHGSDVLVFHICRNNIEETLGENSTATLFEMQIPARPARNTFYIREKDDTGPPKKIGVSLQADTLCKGIKFISAFNLVTECIVYHVNLHFHYTYM